MEHTKECLAGGYCNCAIELPKQEKQCPECKVRIHLYPHHPTCSQQTLEEKVEEINRVYEWWVKERQDNHERQKYLKNQITFWQGKFNIVRLENNKLRKRNEQLKMINDCNEILKRIEENEKTNYGSS